MVALRYFELSLISSQLRPSKSRILWLAYRQRLSLWSNLLNVSVLGDMSYMVRRSGVLFYTVLYTTPQFIPHNLHQSELDTRSLDTSLKIASIYLLTR